MKYQPSHEVDKFGYPTDPKLKELQSKLQNIADKFYTIGISEEEEDKLVSEYHNVFEQLYKLGWDGMLHFEEEIPDDLLPKEYTRRYPPVENAWNIKYDDDGNPIKLKS